MKGAPPPRSNQPVPADTSIPFTVDAIIVYEGQHLGFGISVRCPASRLYENVGKGLGIRVTRVEHQRPMQQSRTPIPNETSVWLLEDCGVKSGSLLHVFGEPLDEKDVEIPSDMVELKLDWKGVLKEPIPYLVRKGCDVKHIVRSIRLQFDVLPDSVKLFYRGQELRDMTAVPQWAPGEMLTMEGTFFPISLVKGAQFAQNLGIYPSSECVVCLEKIQKELVFFECGHANVCPECWKDKPKEKCPVCY